MEEVRVLREVDTKPAAAAGDVYLKRAFEKLSPRKIPRPVGYRVLAVRSSYEFERAAAERWERIALLPGLDLIVRADAREPARLVAQRICEVYSVR